MPYKPKTRPNAELTVQKLNILLSKRVLNLNVERTIIDAITLIEAEEDNVKVTVSSTKPMKLITGNCPVCGLDIMERVYGTALFCPRCGQAIAL